MDVAQPARHEPPAELRLVDPDRDALGRGGAGLDQPDLREADRRAGRDRDLPGKADEREGVPAVRLHVDVEDRVAVQGGQL
jgi:hypothetical protein